LLFNNFLSKKYKTELSLASPLGDTGGTPRGCRLTAVAARFLASVPPRRRPSSRWQGAGVHPLVDRVLNRVLLGLGFACRRCSAVELGFAGGAWLLCGLVFLAASTMRKRRHCRGIISPSFFRSPMAIYSDVNREAGETCPGVEGRHIVIFSS
jgi:hypothetical protein